MQKKKRISFTFRSFYSLFIHSLIILINLGEIVLVVEL